MFSLEVTARAPGVLSGLHKSTKAIGCAKGLRRAWKGVHRCAECPSTHF